jgi:hypothetical protein
VAITTFRTAEFLEDRGWEAVPLVPLPPEIPPIGIPVRPDQPPPNVLVDIEDAAVRAALGEIGWSKVFLAKQFGPRQRLAAILTDMPLEPDPLVTPGTICKRDMVACVAGYPGAIPHIREGKTVQVQIEDHTYEWADLHTGKCCLSFHGGDSRPSPYYLESHGLIEQCFHGGESIKRPQWTLPAKVDRRGNDLDPPGETQRKAGAVLTRFERHPLLDDGQPSRHGGG